MSSRSGSGSSSGRTPSTSCAGSGRMVFGGCSSQASARSGSSRTSSGSGSSRSSVSTNSSRGSSNSGSSHSSVSMNSSRTSGSSGSSQMSLGSNSIQSTVNGLEPDINSRKHANRNHKMIGWSGPRLQENPRVKAYADKKSDQMEKKAWAERKATSEARKKQGYYIENDMA